MALQSYRVKLLRDIFLLASGVAVLVLATTWLLNSWQMDAMVARQFREVSRREILFTQSRLRAAVPALDALDSLLAGELSEADSGKRARVFLGFLRANPDFTWVSYGDEQGGFVGVYRTASGVLRVNRSTIHDGQTELFEHEISPDGTWKEIRHAADSHYDPRTRSFYLLAKEAGHRIWTPPYVFFEQGVPGITCATPFYGPGPLPRGTGLAPLAAETGPLPRGTGLAPLAAETGHRLQGVLTIDFDLNSLSSFARTADLSKNGKVFLFTPDGTLLAHPGLTVVAAPGKGSEGKLLTLNDVDDPQIHAFAQHAQQEHVHFDFDGGKEKVETFSFPFGGRTWLASYNSFMVDELGLTWVVAAIAPRSDFVGSLRRWTVAVFLLLMVVILVVSWRASMMIAGSTAPLLILADEMERAGRFDLAERPLPATSLLEIASMNHALVAMKSSLKSFASYIPRDLVRALLEAGHEAVLGGKIATLTIFFSDIEGFTSIAEPMPPGDLVRLLGEYLEEMTQIIASTGGTVDKFLGDGILAFWGAPANDEAHAQHAAEAALACQARLKLRFAEGAFGGKKLTTRIGLATGPVLVGNIGTRERMNYTVMGDTANLASRLEGLNKVYGTQVLVTEATVAGLGAKIVARPVDLVAVKGKTQAVKVFDLLSSDGADARRIAALCEQALADYLARDFANAAAGWAAVLELSPSDVPAATMRTRAQAFARTPPPADWNGVFTAEK